MHRCAPKKSLALRHKKNCKPYFSRALKKSTQCIKNAKSVDFFVKTSVNESEVNYGMLFVADIYSFGEIHSEIEKILITDKPIDNWTYPMIQPKLLQEAQKRGPM